VRHDLEFVDDAVFLLQDFSIDGLLDRARKTLDVIVDVFEAHGLRANLAKGKTEIMIKLHCCGSRVRWSTFPVDGKSKDKLLVTPLGRTIHIVSQYTHLGSVRTTSGSNIPDARAKATKCNAAFAPLAQNVFGNKSIHLHTRLSLA